MHVVAFAPSLSAVVDDAGGVNAQGFPMTSCRVESFPAHITVPLVLAVYTQGGTDYDPQRFIIGKSPRGETVGVLESRWHWPDNPGAPVKYRVFAHQLPLHVSTAGVYTIGLYETRDATETAHQFPLPVLKANPFTMPASPPSG